MTIQFTYHRVSRVGNNRTEDTSKIPGNESDGELSQFRVTFLTFGADVVVNVLDEPLERYEFDDCVGHLPTP